MEGGRTAEDVKAYGKNCAEDEISELKDFFKVLRKLETVPMIVKNRLGRLKEEFKRKYGGVLTEENVQFANDIIDHCKRYVESKKCFSQLLIDEQERELEAETEEERQIERPGAAKPHVPSLNSTLKQHVEIGKTTVGGLAPSYCREVHTAFTGCIALGHLNVSSVWDSMLSVSYEFTKVITGAGNLDEFIRNVNWILVFKNGQGGNITKMLLITPFEANALFPILRQKRFDDDRVTLHMFSPRLSLDHDTLFFNDVLTLPSISGSNEKLRKDPMINNLLAQVAILSGSLFFGSSVEQTCWLDFLGIYPLAPSTEESQKLLDERSYERWICM
eukprot:TRINITY_DN2774_c1_g4_i2.p1 TRINITY_DN2774_c1_g4~~TRINITY_DN2774_c1_g4_i2.p1  ORF type:complete len:332 (-),score=135.86 TRINITY_DN2774_c1_g4_i2:308-1303(-)